jgi:hypothetical protein
MKGLLKIGDQVIWRGAWGSELPKKATVESIEVCEPGTKYGDEVDQIEWSRVRTRGVIVTFSDNDHWAYGNQITKL